MSYNKNSPQSIQQMFDSIARSYDKTNAILSFNMHKRWNRSLIDHVLQKTRPTTFLDLCCGTGAIGLDYLSKTSQPTTAYLLDFSQEMLACAKEQANRLPPNQHKIHFIQADAQKIPLPNSSINSVCIAYGIRNIKTPSQCIKEVARVLTAGGTFGILELTQPKNAFIRWGHGIYLKYLLPLVGKLMTSNRDAYQYLCGSIPAFIPPNELELLLKRHGFQNIESKPLFGGVATLLMASKNT